MIRFFADANYDFIGVRRYAYAVTGALFALSLVALIGWGLNYSIEFTGGTLVRVKAAQEVDVARLRSALETQGITGPEIKVVESPRRAGDPPLIYADSGKIRRELGWAASVQTIDEVIETAWRWFVGHPRGYKG